MFPIGWMYYFGTNLDNRFSVPDFWPKPEETNRIPFEREDIRKELDRLQPSTPLLEYFWQYSMNSDGKFQPEMMLDNLRIRRSPQFPVSVLNHLAATIPVHRRVRCFFFFKNLQIELQLLKTAAMLYVMYAAIVRLVHDSFVLIYGSLDHLTEL